MLNIEPIAEVGPYCTGNIQVAYAKLVEAIGFEPNATHLDDESKVKASWGLSDGIRKAFVWCYKHYGDPVGCVDWSTYDPDGLLKDILK